MSLQSLNWTRQTTMVVLLLTLAALVLLVRPAVALPGDLDVSFNGSGPTPGYVLAKVGRASLVRDEATQVARQSDGKLVQVGTCRGVFVLRACLARFNADGSIDTTFNPDATQGGLQPDLQPGELIIDEGVGGQQFYGVTVAILPSGRILVGATCTNATSGFTDFCVIAVTSGGVLDTGFNTSGAFPGLARVTPAAFYSNVRGMTVQGDGRIVLVGACGQQIIQRTFCAVRFQSNGVLDSSFNAAGSLPGVRVEPVGSDGDSDAVAVAEQGDGKLVVAGNCTDAGQHKYCVMRLSAAGVLDTSFAAPQSGKLTLALANDEHVLAAVAIQSDGKAVLAGGCKRINAQFEVDQAICIARLTSNGSLDVASFNASAALAERGYVRFNVDSTNDAATGLRLIAGGKIALAGICRYDQGMGTGVICLAQLNADGSFDTAFGVGGKAIQASVANQRDLAQHMLVQPDGKWIVSAQCFRGAPDVFCLARFDGISPAASCALNVDGNAVLEAQSDGVLILRYLFGMRGAALTGGALGNGATRSGVALETYLAGLNLDGDGDALPSRATTDGQLIVRAILGMTGNALTAGAINTTVSGTRDAEGVRSWISATHGASCLP